MTTTYTIMFPRYFDVRAGEISAKGYFADVTIEALGKKYRPIFYDPVRLGQEISDELARGSSAYFEPNIIVVSQVSRDSIESAIAMLAETSFAGLQAEE